MEWCLVKTFQARCTLDFYLHSLYSYLNTANAVEEANLTSELMVPLFMVYFFYSVLYSLYSRKFIVCIFTVHCLPERERDVSVFKTSCTV